MASAMAEPEAVSAVVFSAALLHAAIKIIIIKYNSLVKYFIFPFF
jgi:hypothetical protein